MKLRSLLFVPADSERKFAKADGIGADALILDLEDSVAPGRKTFARDAVKSRLGGGPRNWAFVVRINPLGKGLTLEDLAAVVRPGLDGLLLPKVNGIEDVDLVSHYVDVLEGANGVTPGHVKLLTVATETPAAMIGFNGYARKNKRLVALTWGGEDLSAALGGLTPREADGSWTFPYQVARAQCLFAAGAADAAALETVYVDFRDQRGWLKAAGSPAAMALSAASRSTRIRSRPSTAALRRQMTIWSMHGASLPRSRPRPISAPSGSRARCTTFRIWSRRNEPWRRSGRAVRMDRSFANQLDMLEDHAAIREGVRAVVARFDDEYWLARDEDGEFPREFHRAMADAGWLGITMPKEYGGAGLGVTEAAIMMHEVASHGGGMTSASAVHINLFGPHPIVVKGTDDQKRRWVPRLVSGEDQCCFGFTEPDAGLNTTRIKTFAEKVPGGYLVHGQKVWTSTAQIANKIMLLTRTTKFDDCKRPTDGITIFYTDLDRSKIEVRRIPKMGRKAVDSNAIFIDGLFIPEADRIGEEGKGFSYVLHSLNPERILIAVEAIGIGQDALRRATRYARERVVFDRPIGQNQAIQHPLAENWMYLESAWLMAMSAAWLYDSGRPCGAESNSAKLLGARAGHDAAWQAIMTHGGFGYAKEYHVERLFREVSITRLAPITEQLILSFIAEKVLDLPKSY